MNDPGIDFEVLMKKRISVPAFRVDGLIPQVGHMLLAGQPKLGKSWLTYDLAISVASGRTWLGRPTQPCDVLLLALEDDEPRLRTRGEVLNGSDKLTHKLSIVDMRTTEPGSHKRLITPSTYQSVIKDWVAKGRKGNGLVIIDTTTKIRDGERTSYASDYKFIDAITQLAHRLEIGIVSVTHTKQGKRDNALNEIQGTNGIGGACDNAIVFRKRDREAREGTLTVMGRDVPEATLPIRVNEDTRRYEEVSDYIEVEGTGTSKRRSALRQSILEYMAKHDQEMTPGQVAVGIGEDQTKVRIYFRRMAEYGELECLEYGRYRITDQVRVEFDVRKPVKKAERPNEKEATKARSVNTLHTGTKCETPSEPRRSLKKKAPLSKVPKKAADSPAAKSEPKKAPLRKNPKQLTIDNELDQLREKLRRFQNAHETRRDRTRFDDTREEQNALDNVVSFKARRRRAA